jgi:hypothetical protein
MSMMRFWNNLQQGYSRHALCSLLSKLLILSVPAAAYSRNVSCSLLSMTRFWNNLQQVLSKSKVWKVVNMSVSGITCSRYAQNQRFGK